MGRERLKRILAIIATIGITVVIFSQFKALDYEDIISFPFSQISGILRWLSLSSDLGNVVAIVLYIGISSIPLILLLKKYRNLSVVKEDVLLLVLSILLYISLYFMINPREMTDIIVRSGLESFGVVILSSVNYIVIIGYVILKLLRRFSNNETGRLLNDLSIAIMFTSAIFVIAICAVTPFNVIGEIKAIRVTNTELSGLTMSDIFIVLKYLVISLPTFFGVVISFKTLDMIDEIKIDRYSSQMIKEARALEVVCQKAIIVSTVSVIAFNVIQLLFAKSLIKADFKLTIPITSILLVLITMLLTRFFTETKEIKEEIDMFV